MLAPSRAARFLAGLSIVLLAIPLALSTPWARSAVLGAATAWARSRFGVDIRAARLDYRLTALSFRLDDVAVADPATPTRPFFTIGQLELDLAASALRGRLDFDRIRVLRPSVVLDSTTRPSRPAGGQAAPDATPAAVPAFEIGVLEIVDLDLVAGDSTATRVVVRQLTSTFHGRGSQRLDGDVVAAGGVDLSFPSAAIQVAFDRVEARVGVDGGRRTVSGSLSAHSPVADVRAEGDVPLDAARGLDLRYEAAGQVAELGRWWPDTPDLRGRATVRGRIRGALQAPEASFEAGSPDLAWSSLAPATLSASGRVSLADFELDAFSLVSVQGAIDGRGRLAFDDADRSDLNGKWRNLSSDVVADVLALPAGALPHAVMSGSATLAWPGLQPAVHRLEGRLEATATARAPDDTAVGALVAEGRTGRWRLGYRQALDDHTRASLDSVVVVDADRFAQSTVAGSIDLQSQDLHAALLQLRRLGLLLPAAAAAVGSERVAFDGAMEGSLDAPRVRGALAAEGVRIGEVTDVRVHGTVGLDAHALELSPLTIESAGNQAVIQGTLPWTGTGGEGTFEAHVAQPEHVASMVPATWRPAGTFDVSGAWRGSAQAPRVTARLSGTHVTANGLTFESVSADVELADRIARVARLHATQPNGSLDGTGAWNFEDSTLVADAAATGLDMSILAPDDSGTLVARARLADVSIDTHVDGAMSRVAGRASLTAGAVEIDGQPIGPVQGRADAAGGVAHVTAGAPEIGVSADGRVILDAQRAFEGRLTLDGSDVNRLGHLAGLELDGVSVTLDATADTSGTLRDLAAVRAAVALTRLEGRIRERPLALSQAGRVLVEDGVVRIVEPMHLTLGATTLDVAASGGATPGAGVLVTLDGPLADVTAIVPSAMPEGVAVDGTVRAEVRLGPRLAALAPTGSVTLDVTAIRRGDRELARGMKVVAEGDAGMIRVRELTGTVLGSPVEARGTAPMAWVRAAPDGAPGVAGEPATFSLRSQVALGPLVSALTERPLNITGTVNLALDGSASAPRLDAVQATIVQQAGDVTLSGVALTQQMPTRLRLEQGRLLLEAFEWRGPESTVAASGTVGLADGVDGRLQLKGDASLAMLTLFVPARVSGRAKFDVEVSGTAGARALLGTIGIDDGNMVVQAWRVAMADWSGQLVFDKDSIAVTGLHGQFNGGEATIEGRVPVGSAGAAAQSVTLAVRGAFLELPRGLRSQLDAALEWSHTGGRARLSGNATVTAQTYREPATELARIASMLVDQSGRSSVELPAVLAATALDVRLATIGPLSMTNSVARVELMPELQLTGTVGRPALDGQVAVADDGRIQFGGRQYRFRDSRLEFRPERGMVPRLDLTGDTRVGDYTVHLRLSGPANEIETSLSSDPPLGERDLQTLLVTGQRETLGRGGDADQMAVGAVSGDVLGFAGQFLGFDSVVVGTTDDLSLVSSDVDPALRLTVSKRLGNRFELVLSDNLDDNELTWVVIYRPRPGFEFRVVSRDNTEFTGEFRQEIPFGPGVSPPRATARRQVERELIDAVTVSGDPGLTQADVLSATDLRSGDRFDFGRWLEDRERIARRYLEQGYFSVRIVPTRRPVEGAADGARVALDYRIARGPRTVLSVEGYSPAPALLDQLRQAWADSALLELLAVDLERVMRQHLVASGFLRATLAVDVDQSTLDQVTATVKVEPGPLSSDRRLAFSGNTAISDKELLAAAQPRTVVAGVPWLDPEPLLEALESAYAARGYLAAKATAGAVVFSNGSATLPIHVVEGPVARVATLSVAGADGVGEADAATGTGLAVGATYIAGGEQAARLALERYYRNLGYRDVTVESKTTVNAGEGRVDVAVTVHEGPRYVVQSVRTTGVESTRDALVERATHVEPGSAASPANVEAIRRRLYDLGTFRSAEVTYAPIEAPSTAVTVPVDAVVSLQESRRFLFLYGLEATSEYQSVFDQRVTSGGVAADLRDRNFLGRGWTLGAGARYEPSFWSTRVLASVPRIGARRIRTNLYVDKRSEDRSKTETVVFRDAETAVTLEQRWRPRTPVEFSWGYRFDYRDLQFVSVETAQRLGFDGYLSGPVGAVVVDRRDSMFDAKRGWLTSTSAQWGLQLLGSDFDYLRTLVRASHYQPVGPLTVASNVRWGHLQSFGGRPPLTALDLFYQAGGTQTVRGYQQDSLSAYELQVPGSPTPVPVGGTSLLVLNEEVRFPLFGRVSGAAFADAGNTFTAERGVVLDDLAVGLGVGLRIRTPLAPIRLDLGFPVPRRPGESAVRWHFSIGQIF